MEKRGTSFSVISIGAGVTSLVFANILAKANVDFMLLEAYEAIDRPAGGIYGV